MKLKILLFFSSGLGDVLFVAPTILALKDMYPSAQITVMLPYLKFNRYLLENILGVDNTILLERLRTFSPIKAVSYFSYFYMLCKDVRSQKFDMVILTSQARLIDQYLLSLVSGAKQRIGPKYWRRKKNPFRFLLSSMCDTASSHLVDNNFDIIRLLDKNANIHKYVNKVSEVLKLKEEISNFTPVTDKLLIVLPGSGTQPYKRWPLSNFIEVIGNVLSRYNCDIAVLGGTGEYDKSLIPSEIIKNKRFHNIGNTLILPQVINLFSHANLILSNDNGLLHLAEFLNKPTIGIYPGNWTYVSRRYLDNDMRHIVYPNDQPDILAEKLSKQTWRTKKIQHLCKDVIISIKPDDIIAEIDRTALLK